MVSWVERATESRTARLLLVALIVLSVLPFPWIERFLWPVFLFGFGLELVARLVLMTEPRHRRLFDWVLVAVDVAAFVSFLPLETLAGEVATPLRLARLLLLLRFMRTLTADVYMVVTRREQLQQFTLVTIAVATMAFVSAVILSLFKVVDEGDPNLERSADFWDRMWWSFRQIESPDNLVGTLDVPPTLALLSLVLTIMGVFVVSFIIGLGANVVGQVVRAERRRPIPYRNHTVVIGAVADGEHLVREFVRIYEKNRSLRRVRPVEVFDWVFRDGPRPRRHALPRMSLLGPEEEPPAYLYEGGMRWVVYRQGDGTTGEALDLINASEAKRAILLANPGAGPDSDAITVAALTAFRERNPDGHVFVEVMESDNEDLMLDVGGAGTFPLDVPSFLGRFLVHHLVIPGIEAVYRSLLTADGSEVYTHVFVEKREIDAVVRFASAHETLPFSNLARDARRHGVLLIGVLLGDEGFGLTGRGLIPVDQLTPLLNPLASNSEIPIRRLRGLIGVSVSYLPLRRYARRLLRAGLELPPRPAGPESFDAAACLSVSPKPVERVLVVGYSPALCELLRTLGRFVPGVQVIVALSARAQDQTSLRERVAGLGLGLTEAPGRAGEQVSLGSTGARVTVYTHQGSDLTQFAVERLEAPVDAAVFLSDPDSPDRDARTLLRVLRFARALEDGVAPRGHKLHLVVEFTSEQRGHRLEQELERRRCGFPDQRSLRVTLLSTDRLKNYFMVHSAFVPGVTELYERLLMPEGQTILRLDLEGAADQAGGTFTIGEIAAALEEHACVPLAIERSGGEVVLQPSEEERFRTGDVDAIFVLGDASRVRAQFRRRSSRTSDAA